MVLWQAIALADTLDVQWVLEECLDQLGIQMSEGSVQI